MRIVIDTKDKRIVVPKSFFPEIDRMNRILEENKTGKKIIPEEYVREQFEAAMNKSIIRPGDKEL